MRHFFLYLIGCGSEVTLRTFFLVEKKVFFLKYFDVSCSTPNRSVRFCHDNAIFVWPEILTNASGNNVTQLCVSRLERLSPTAMRSSLFVFLGEDP
jgi:hypothetical protein